MKIGFTGTRHGMTEAQRGSLRSLLGDAGEFHHGDCIGADAQAHDIARDLGLEVVVHPPKVDTMRAWKTSDSDRIREPKPFLARNRDIVRETDMFDRGAFSGDRAASLGHLVDCALRAQARSTVACRAARLEQRLFDFPVAGFPFPGDGFEAEGDAAARGRVAHRIDACGRGHPLLARSARR